MIEIPEAQTLAKQLNESLRGKGIRKAAAGASPHGFAFYTGDSADYSKLLEGQSIGQARALSGLVEIDIGNLRLVLNDGAAPRYLPPGANVPAKHQLFLAFEDDSHLICTIRMYGGIHLQGEDIPKDFYYNVAREKPNPLSSAFDLPYFRTLIHEAPPTLSAKALLATEQRIPGLGNGCAQDILYAAGINPQSHLRALSEAELEGLFHAVKEVLAAMTTAGGRDVERDLYGNPGGYQTRLSKRTAAYACPRCGGGITRKAFLGGNVYFCPTCQPVKK